MSHDVSETWRLNHPWASLYSFGMARPTIARTVGVVAFGTSFAGLYDAIDSIRDVPGGGVVLDVPCGAGIALKALRRTAGVRYIAADIAPAMLRRTAAEAARLGVTVETLEADVASLPLADHSVDLCLSLTGLHCFPDPRAAVLELARVTGGRMELTWLRADAGLRFRPVLLAGRAAGLVGPSATLDEVTGWLRDAGFVVQGRTEGSFAYVRAHRADETTPV